MTEDEVLAASLEALGLSIYSSRNIEDAVFDAYVDICRETRKIPTQTAVAERVGVEQSVVSRTCARLAKAGRMRLVQEAGRKPGYVPLVAKAA